MILLSVIFF